MEIECGARRPTVMGEYVEWFDGDAVTQAETRRGEQLVEDPRHREHGRSDVDVHVLAVAGADFSARPVTALENAHREARRGEPDGGAQAGDSGTDDDDGVWLHSNRDVDEDSLNVYST